MKKSLFIVISLVLLLAFTGCDKDIQIIGGADGPTSIIVSEKKDIYPVRMINVDGELYYDSGIFSDLSSRCGTLDGLLKTTVGEYEIPKNSYEANFKSDKADYFGFQNITDMTKEIPLDNGWTIFKKIDNYDGNYKYAFKIKGRHPNAQAVSEYLVLANDLDITFKDITKHLFSSTDDRLDIKLVFIQSHDDWGIMFYTEDVTAKGVTLVCEQFGGEYKGELQTGTPWILQKEESGIWSSYPTKDGKDLVWTGLGLLINKNDKTIWKIDFETHYGKLTPGRYRVGKEITDFRGVGDYENKTYYAVFEIED